MKQLNQSATSKGLMYRRGMHGVEVERAQNFSAHELLS